jgi:BirA family biotin operon repressor/biotin-[acetyl-CoA-carboxylase] ligase
VNDKKIGGILIENQLSGSIISNSIVGIGLNLNQQQFAIDTATSFYRETSREVDLSEALDQLLSFIEARYLQLKAGKLSQLRSEYLDHLFMIRTPFTFRDKESLFIGIIVGIDNIGRLQVDKNGHVSAYDLKEIQYVGPVQSNESSNITS